MLLLVPLLTEICVKRIHDHNEKKFRKRTKDRKTKSSKQAKHWKKLLRQDVKRD